MSDLYKIYASQDYVDQKVSDLVNSAPETLDTLGELATALQENKGITDALDAAIGNKANASDLNAHIGNKENPHNVTAEQIKAVSYNTQSLTDEQKAKARENIGVVLPIIDNTLSNQGQVADAKATGDAITAVENKIPTKVSTLENDAGYLSEITNTAFYLDLAYESGDANSMAFYSIDTEEANNAFAAYLNGIAVFAKFNIEEGGSEKIIAPLMMVVESSDEPVAIFAVTGVHPSTSMAQTGMMIVTASGAVLMMKPLITGDEIDDTLSISGSVADAGAVGEALFDKVDKVSGKGLSTNDFTTEMKNKLDGIAANANAYSLPVATGTALGGVKSGGDITIGTDGTITVNDDSHNHTIANVDNLQTTLDTKVPTSRTINSKALSDNISLTAEDVGADTEGSAAQALTDAKAYADEKVGAISFTETDPTVPAWAKEATKPSYTAAEVGAVPTGRTVNGKALSSNISLGASDVGADASGTASSLVSAHNTSNTAHSDIRNLISGLTTRLNALADSDDTTLDQLSEIVTYIKANKSLIDGITTSKVNVADIINNLTTDVANKPLSAAQGVAIKGLIDALQNEVNGRAKASDLTSHTGNTSNPHSVTKAQVGLGNVENKSSATIRGELTKADVTTALGYTPPTQDTTYTLGSFGITATAAELNYVDGVTSNVQTQLGNKVDKVSGKGLSTNDFTAAYKSKLDGIAAGANAYTLPVAGSALGGIKSGGDITVASDGTVSVNVREVPACSTSDNGKILRVVNGVATWASIANAEGASF